MKKFIAFAILAATIAAPAAFAGETKAFTDTDKNSDGTLSLAEVRAVKPDMRPETFAMANSDANGELTLAEYEAWKSSKAAGPAPEDPKIDQ